MHVRNGKDYSRATVIRQTITLSRTGRGSLGPGCRSLRWDVHVGAGTCDDGRSAGLLLFHGSLVLGMPLSRNSPGFPSAVEILGTRTRHALEPPRRSFGTSAPSRGSYEEGVDTTESAERHGRCDPATGPCGPTVSTGSHSRVSTRAARVVRGQAQRRSEAGTGPRRPRSPARADDGRDPEELPRDPRAASEFDRPLTTANATSAATAQAARLAAIAHRLPRPQARSDPGPPRPRSTLDHRHDRRHHQVDRPSKQGNGHKGLRPRRAAPLRLGRADRGTGPVQRHERRHAGDPGLPRTVPKSERLRATGRAEAPPAPGRASSSSTWARRRSSCASPSRTSSNRIPAGEV